MAARSYGQYCGVTRAVELVGERWALLIVRDLLVGPRRYTDLKQGLPRIPTNILSARLKELQDGGVVRRVALRNCGLVYELTEHGRSLEPVILALSRWGLEAADQVEPEEVVTADALTIALRAAFRSDEARSLPATDYEVLLGAVGLRVQVDGDDLRITQLAPPAPPVGGRMPAGDPDVVLLLSRGLRNAIAWDPTARGLAEPIAEVLAGDPALLTRFAATFHAGAPSYVG